MTPRLWFISVAGADNAIGWPLRYPVRAWLWLTGRPAQTLARLCARLGIGCCGCVAVSWLHVDSVVFAAFGSISAGLFGVAAGVYLLDDAEEWQRWASSWPPASWPPPSVGRMVLRPRWTAVFAALAVFLPFTTLPRLDVWVGVAGMVLLWAAMYTMTFVTPRRPSAVRRAAAKAKQALAALRPPVLTPAPEAS